MTTNPGWDLQKAVRDTLLADAALDALIGGRIHDAAPQDAAFPYAIIGETRMNDWSTGTEDGTEHLLTLNVWSRHEGKREAYAIADAIRNALDDASLTLEDNRLVNLTHQYSDLRRDGDGRTWRAVLRFRAVTEPAM